MYQQGDIVWVPFPLSDKRGKLKMRPAVIISNEASNQLDNDVVIAQITSVLRTDTFSFRLDNSFLEIPLPKNSEVRCNKIATIRKSLIGKKLSRVQQKALPKLVSKICKVFQ